MDFARGFNAHLELGESLRLLPLILLLTHSKSNATAHTYGIPTGIITGTATCIAYVVTQHLFEVMITMICPECLIKW